MIRVAAVAGMLPLAETFTKVFSWLTMVPISWRKIFEVLEGTSLRDWSFGLRSDHFAFLDVFRNIHAIREDFPLRSLVIILASTVRAFGRVSTSSALSRSCSLRILLDCQRLAYRSRRASPESRLLRNILHGESPKCLDGSGTVLSSTGPPTSSMGNLIKIKPFSLMGCISCGFSFLSHTSNDSQLHHQVQYLNVIGKACIFEPPEWRLCCLYEVDRSVLRVLRP